MSILDKYLALSSGRRSAIDELIRLDLWGLDSTHRTDHYIKTLEKAAEEIENLFGCQEIELPAERLEMAELPPKVE